MGNLHDLLESGLGPADGEHPLFPGAVALVMRDGEIVHEAAAGEAVRYGADGNGPALLPLDERVPMRLDTVFDVASLTKLFTATTALSLVDAGKLALDAPVADVLPEWTDEARGAITARHLLAHTSGLPAVKRMWEIPAESRMDALLSATVEHPPGTSFEYSCIGYITLGIVLERLTGKRLDELIRAAIIEPLGLDDTTFLPGGDVTPRIAATEHQPYVDRPMVRGEVHDETNWSLGGVCGNAGLFSTVRNMARFGEMLRRGGELGDVRILRPETVMAMTTDQLTAELDPGYRQGLGPRINDRNVMGVLADSDSFGHTGFTGTSLVVTPALGQVAVLFTNRVHPSREWSDISAFRREFASWSLTASTF
jgi:CubicO group peptidase (beta-lactamase class C family)